jgi:hypothetical protein
LYAKLETLIVLEISVFLSTFNLHTKLNIKAIMHVNKAELYLNLIS